jgi:hypothetical protein
VKRPAWLRKGARVEERLTGKVEHVMGNGWVWLTRDDGGNKPVRIEDLGKTWDRAPRAKAGRKGKR